MSKKAYCKKILIIGPAWVGDMVMAQSLFKCLAAENATIDVLAPNWSRPLLERMPEVHQAIAMPLGHGQLHLKMRHQLAKSLMPQQYDECIVLPNSFKSALIPFWAKIPKRIGWARECRQLILTDTRKLDKSNYPLMIERFMALAYKKNKPLQKPYPVPSLIVKYENVQAALQRLKLNVTNGKITVICPGAEFGSAKRWPAQYYGEVAKHLLEKGEQVWLMGSENDKSVTKAINQLTAYGCYDLAGKTSLGEAIDLMSCAQQVVTNDSGLMHIAAALDRPMVAIYGSSSPSFTPPLSEKVIILREQLPCSPCFKRTCPLEHLNCLKQLKPEKVLSAFVKLNQSVA